MRQITKRPVYKLLIFLTLITMVFIFSSCGSSTEDNMIREEGNIDQDISYSTKEAPAEAPQPQSMDSYGFTAQTTDNAFQTDQKIIYTGNIYIEVDNINEATDTIEKAIKAAGGFLLNSNKSENDYRYYARYEYKVPVEGFYPVIDQINNMPIGKITDQYINGNDVTEEYLDINSRLKAKRVYEERLLDLFSQATETEDLLKISNDLSRVQEEIEQLEGRQKYLSYHSDNSTLTIEIQQYKNKVAPTATSWEKSIDGFKQSIEFIKNLFITLFIWAISSLPILILIFIIVVTLWFFVGRKFKTKKNIITYSDEDSEDNDTK